ncbi:MAG: hypothetical protein AB1631_26660 [Acidobacteriota bacterium]
MDFLKQTELLSLYRQSIVDKKAPDLYFCENRVPASWVGNPNILLPPLAVKMKTCGLSDLTQDDNALLGWRSPQRAALTDAQVFADLETLYPFSSRISIDILVQELRKCLENEGKDVRYFTFTEMRLIPQARFFEKYVPA